MPRHLDEVLTQTKRFYTAKTQLRHWQRDLNASQHAKRAPIPIKFCLGCKTIRQERYCERRCQKKEGWGQSSPLQVGLEPFEKTVFPLSNGSVRLCTELPRRACRISVRVNR